MESTHSKITKSSNNQPRAVSGDSFREVKLRPYHPTYMVCYFVDQSIMSEDHNKRGFDFVLDILKKYPDTNIKLVHCFDDICLRCVKRRPDTKGSVWGKDSSCTSSDNPEVVKGVHESNDRTLAILGLHYGSVIKWMDLVKLLREKIPVLNDKWIGGLENQERYEKGLRMLLG